MDHSMLYVGGKWVGPHGTGVHRVIDPATEQVFATVPAGDAVDVDRAVTAARAGVPEWSAEPPAVRSGVLRRVAEALQARTDELADIEAHEIGMPKAQAAAIQVRAGVTAFAGASEVVERYRFEGGDGGLLLREPVGVVGAITPWNYPLNQIGAKVAYALAAGCTVVLKPSEVAPVSAFVLAEIVHDLGLPPGTFNLVSGDGPVAGEALASHPGVDMVSFTGSTRAGTRVAELAARSVKRVALELGGKSPNVILDDADLAEAVGDGVASAFANSGQTCTALTRMLVPRGRLGEVEAIARLSAEAFTVGDPFAGATRLGPLVSAAQRDRVRGYIRTGIEEGAKLLTGGAEAPDGLPTGYFVRPTVFSEVTRDMTIAREEIFGPVLSIMPYDSEEEAVDIANDTDYGLAAGVWGSEARAAGMARRIRAGQVRINGGRPWKGAPLGGYKRSGIGREHGVFGLEEFLEVKAVFG